MICIVGLGYVGLPLAVAFAEKGNRVVGIDINKERIEELKNGNDGTNEVSSKRLKEVMKNIKFTTKIEDARGSEFFIITVPTPITKEKIPNLTPVKKASESIAKVIEKNAIVILESTVYPGVTEEIVGKTIEEKSGLKAKKDFKLAYSPERANPGDRVHTLKTITKVIGAQDKETEKRVGELYMLIVDNIFIAKSIKVAEAAKVIENTQRDINIALMNELAIVFDKIGICIWDVLEAARTKWNFLDFKPGLVGGHCIPVDPYYLLYKAESVGYHPEIIASGRRVSDYMDDYILGKIIKALNDEGMALKERDVLFLGLTFKENVPDTRNSLAYRLAKKIEEYGANVVKVDPIASIAGENIYQKIPENKEFDVVVFAVSHNKFIESKEEITKIRSKVFVDIKGVFKDRKIFGKYISF